MFGRRNEYINMLGINRDVYRDMREQMNNKKIIEDLTGQLSELNMRYFNLCEDIRSLERENALLKNMFNSSEDTQAIRYNGKLFRITDTTHFKSNDAEDQLDVTAFCVTMEVK